MALSSCGDKPAPPPAIATKAPSEVVCSIAPSQSALFASLTGAAGGSAVATAALAHSLGLTVVTHSSGALILTGGSGYIAGTIGAAAATGPVLIGAGIVASGTSGIIELLCAPRNHPEMVAQIEVAASEFATRSNKTVSSATASAGSFIAEQRVTLIKSGEEAIAFANRKTK